MATQILNLPLVSYPLVVGNNEDWLDSWAYLDAGGNPISLAGLTINFMVKLTPGSNSAAVIASTAATVAGLPVNGTVLIGGAAGNVVALDISAVQMSRVAAGSYVYEMQALGDGEKRTVASGTVTVLQGVLP